MSGLINVIGVEEYGNFLNGYLNGFYWFIIKTDKTVDYANPYFDFGEHTILTRGASTTWDYYSFLIKTNDDHLAVMLKMMLTPNNG